MCYEMQHDSTSGLFSPFSNFHSFTVAGQEMLASTIPLPNLALPLMSDTLMVLDMCACAMWCCASNALVSAGNETRTALKHRCQQAVRELAALPLPQAQALDDMPETEGSVVDRRTALNTIIARSLSDLHTIDLQVGVLVSIEPLPSRDGSGFQTGKPYV